MMLNRDQTDALWLIGFLAAVVAVVFLGGG